MLHSESEWLVECDPVVTLASQRVKDRASVVLEVVDEFGAQISLVLVV